MISIDAPFYGDPAPTGPPGPTDGLWEFEVVELFVASAARREVYTELEFGPWGHHLGLRFDGVRNRIASGFPMAMEVERRGNRWSAEVRVDLAQLPERPWAVNAFAICRAGGSRRFTLAHPLPGETPDFHQPAHFPLAAG